ncbi:MAG: aspartate ammonia-lyase [Spirochaetales bacterium]|nr:aspartate ammonia-lyase [Spirochaetales bacterium]
MERNARTEKDVLGQMSIDADDLRGIHTHRALHNFNISGRTVSLRLIHSYALVKKACAMANREEGYLDPSVADAICAATDEILSGIHDSLFTLDALQGGAGTSTNMAVNEVIANRASQIAGQKISPLGHVNLHQSTNDTYPTALKISLIRLTREAASAAESLQGALQKKEKEFSSIVTLGRTELMSAVPMTLGREFSAFAECVGRDRWRTFKCEERLRVVNLGGTAVGTALAAPRSYVFRATDTLRALCSLPLSRAENLVDNTANIDALVEVAGIFQAAASNLIKIARDLRFLAHTEEISLPPLQAGSSIMPSKINPVLLEAIIQCGMKMSASLSLVPRAAAEGSLQINEYLPLVADAMIESIELYINGSRSLATHIAGINANQTTCEALVDSSPITLTAFLPLLGYEGCQNLISQWKALSPVPPLRSFLIDTLGEETVLRFLSPSALIQLGFTPHKGAPHD